ncbi:hypothetical protein DVV95_11940 [Clostridium botulinum]|uniref:hypothetical protein n=1 Tax=Clostridium botulinum TaxID=1491 RepID=UPI0019684B19|nr:hypothetical protein [Clostridium botulinum]MBN1062513.1 hypothetical protein [Clostridium botulinum]
MMKKDKNKVTDSLYESESIARKLTENSLGMKSVIGASERLADSMVGISRLSKSIVNSGLNRVAENGLGMERMLGVSERLADSMSGISRLSEGIVNLGLNRVAENGLGMERMLGVSERLADSMVGISRLSEGIVNSGLNRVAENGLVMESMLGVSERLADSMSGISRLSEGILSSGLSKWGENNSAMKATEGISAMLLDNASAFSKISEGILGLWDSSIAMEGISKMGQVCSSFYNISEICSLTNSLVTNGLADSFQILSDNLKMNDIDFENFDIDLYNSEQIEEAKAFTRDTLELDINEYKLNWQQKLEMKCKEFSKKNPVYAFLIKSLITYIVVNCIIANAISGVGTVVKGGFKQINNYSSSVDIKNVKDEVIRRINRQYDVFSGILNLYRYINKENVFIRNAPNMKANRIVCLNRGDIVQLVYKDKYKQRFKGWLFVEYEDSDENCCSGWINNIYTRRLAK